MFVVIRGSVNVQIPEKNRQKTVNTLHENDFFGEMGLLTGEPRSANVMAAEETEVLQIRKAGLKPILESNPRLVEAISESIEQRKQLLNAEIATENEEQKGDRHGIMRSIKKFFSLN
jgi:CRP-like cAMP-binding protein